MPISDCARESCSSAPMMLRSSMMARRRASLSRRAFSMARPRWRPTLISSIGHVLAHGRERPVEKKVVHAEDTVLVLHRNHHELRAVALEHRPADEHRAGRGAALDAQAAFGRGPPHGQCPTGISRSRSTTSGARPRLAMSRVWPSPVASRTLAARASTSSMKMSRNPSSSCSRLPGWLRLVAVSYRMSSDWVLRASRTVGVCTCGPARGAGAAASAFAPGSGAVGSDMRQSVPRHAAANMRRAPD